MTQRRCAEVVRDWALLMRRDVAIWHFVQLRKARLALLMRACAPFGKSGWFKVRTRTRKSAHVRACMCVRERASRDA
eukprot:4397765-Pleurochrysis_carterae.AAC.5